MAWFEIKSRHLVLQPFIGILFAPGYPYYGDRLRFIVDSIYYPVLPYPKPRDCLQDTCEEVGYYRIVLRRGLIVHIVGSPLDHVILRVRHRLV